MSDTKEAFDQIKRDLRDLKKQKIELESDLVHNRSEIEYLEPVLARIRQEYAESKQKKETTEKDLAESEHEYQDKKQKLEVAEQAIATAQIELADLETELEKSRAGYDQLLLDYEFTKRQEIAENIRGLESRQNEMDRHLKNEADHLDEVRIELSSEAAELDSFRRKVVIEKETLVDSINHFAERNMATEAENERLRRDNEALLEQQTELHSTMLVLRDEISQFQNYEEKAWAVLRSKDEALQQREADLSSRENLRPPKSFLPPIDS